MASVDFHSHLIVVVSMDLLPVCLHIGHGSAAGKALYKLLNLFKCLKFLICRTRSPKILLVQMFHDYERLRWVGGTHLQG